MILNQHYWKVLAIVLGIGVGISCKKNTTTVPQNVQNNCTVQRATSLLVNINVLSGSAQFFPISGIGGFTYIPSSQGGLSGIIVYRESQSQFIALERNCTKDGCANSKALVWIMTGNVQCKDSICGSVFNVIDGSVQTGPANIPLYQYKTTWDGTNLHIYN